MILYDQLARILHIPSSWNDEIPQDNRMSIGAIAYCERVWIRGSSHWREFGLAETIEDGMKLCLVCQKRASS